MSEINLIRTGKVLAVQQLEKRVLVILQHPDTGEVTAHRLVGNASLKFTIHSLVGETRTFAFRRGNFAISHEVAE